MTRPYCVMQDTGHADMVKLEATPKSGKSLARG
jgi:hypothetical protein